MKEKKSVILVDLDNVIADQVGGFLDIIKREYPYIECPSIDAVDHFDIELCFPVQYRELIKAIRLRKGFFRALPMVQGAKEGLDALIATGHDLRIVTAPTWKWQHCVPEKYAWVEEHLGREWCGRMIVTRDKTFVSGDILIDDKPVVSGARVPTWEHVLYDQPYNRVTEGKKRVTWGTLGSIFEM